MTAVIYPVITNAGLNAAIASAGNGLQLAITHVSLGTGQYTPANPNTQTAMFARKETVTIAGGFATAAGFNVTVLFPGWAGSPSTYNATEIGFYAGDPDAGGVLFAVYSSTTDVLVARNALEFVAQFALALSRVPVGSVVVTIDPGASQSLALVAAHEGKPDPHPQYVLVDGSRAMTGPLTLPGNATANLHAVTLQQVRAAMAGEVGKISYVSAIAAPANHVDAFGPEIGRVAYGELWAIAQASGTLVDEATYANRPGCYSYGPGGVNGTTFRPPKVNGLVIKAFHGGDATFTTDTTLLMGAYAPDQVLAHKHTYLLGGTRIDEQGGNQTDSSDGNRGIPTENTSTVGGAENTVRSVILRPVVRYKLGF